MFAQGVERLLPPRTPAQAACHQRPCGCGGEEAMTMHAIAAIIFALPALGVAGLLVASLARLLALG